VKENDTSAAAVKEEKSDAVNAVNNWDKATQQLFVSHLVHLFPSITCVCYNETHDQSRPTKDDPLHLIHGQYRYVLEQTPTGLSYQISPDAFCEINHEVEDLQYAQTVEWINKQEYQNAILVCSGRDVNSYGLGFGSILNQKGEKLFSEVVAVQHCPLVAIDAIANYKRHENEIKATVLHLSKDKMASGVTLALDQALERNNYPPVVVVTTGGRKGLNHTYLNLLNNHKSVQCIVYNSCSTKSLEVDIEGFMSGPEGYYIDNFRSYDFFAGTKYTASVTHLVRRPRTLVLPVGPAGVGKSTLATMLVEKSPAKSFLWWHRDLEFANLRNANVSMTKTKSLIHDKMLLFLNGECKSIRFVDSTNGNNGARALYVQETRPELLLVVVLSPSTEQNRNKDDIVDILLERTRNRLEGGNDTHPSFPTTVDEQRQKHKSILKGIEYPSASEVAGIGVHDLRKMIVHCNPRDESKLASLPFEIFLVYSISSYLYQGLCRDRFNNTAITC
jgi:hypothetical protein